MRELLELLEAGPGNSLLPGLAWLAGQEVELDEESCARRCAAPSSCSRPAAIRGASSSSTAATSPRSPPTSTAETAREQLQEALARLTGDSEGLAAVSDGLARLRSQPDLAWRSYACALLAEALAGRLMPEPSERSGEKSSGSTASDAPIAPTKSVGRRPIVDASAPPKIGRAGSRPRRGSGARRSAGRASGRG